MEPNIPNNIGFLGNATPMTFTSNSQFPPPPFDFHTEMEIPGYKIKITITQQNFFNNTIMPSNATEASTSFSYARNLAQYISPLVSQSETFSFEISGFKINITVVPISVSNPMFHQDQQYVIANNSQQN
jgi:hypothetical protein